MKGGFFLPIVMAVLALSACSSSLKVYDGETDDEKKGIPISTPELVRITEVIKYEPAPNATAEEAKYCTEETNIKYQFMALGEKNYINFEAAKFGKSEFGLEFFESGLLKSLSLNSDASAGVDSVTGFLDTLLPFVRAPKVQPAEDLSTERATAQKKKEQFCIKGGTQVKDIEIEDIGEAD